MHFHEKEKLHRVWIMIINFNRLQLPEYFEYIQDIQYFMENLNDSRPSEHPPVRGKNVKTFGWDHRLQIQNLFQYCSKYNNSHDGRVADLSRKCQASVVANRVEILFPKVAWRFGSMM